MDDLKLYGNNDGQLEGLLKTVKMVSDDIKMEFGLDKCAKATFKRGKKECTDGIEIDNQVIQELEPEATYTYLGIEEGDGTEHHKMKLKIRKEYKRRIRLVMKSELNARNKIAAINTLAIPVVTYSFGIIDWKLNEIQALDITTRKFMHMNKMHATKADVDRIYLPCQEGGRGLTSLEREYKATMIGLSVYINEKRDKQIRALRKHQENKALHSVTKEATKYLKEIGTEANESEGELSATKKAKKLKYQYKKKYNTHLRQKWINKPQHGQFPKLLDKTYVDIEQSFQWMKHSGLKGETEGLIISAQDQAINTRYQSKHIYHQSITDICRMCHHEKETVTHIMAGCSVLAADQYLNRHNKVAAQLHLDICKHYGIKIKAENWYQHEPERVVENDQATILWDSPINTDRQIACNKPDIVIKEKNTDKCLIIDIAVPNDHNIQKKATEKMSKYVDLQIECQRMWNKKVEVVPVIIGATGVVERNIKKYLNKIPGKHNIYNLQRSAVLGTAHILRKVLSLKPE